MMGEGWGDEKLVQNFGRKIRKEGTLGRHNIEIKK
jgi:hypothetical protein